MGATCLPRNSEEINLTKICPTTSQEIPESQMPDSQPPDTEPTSQDVVDLEKETEVEEDTTDGPTITQPSPEKPKTVFGSDKPPPLNLKIKRITYHTQTKITKRRSRWSNSKR
jgi:hypothetical protein